MCQCFQIGGPFIAEDPDCPEHGTAAEERREERQALRARVEAATTVEELRTIVLEALDREY